MIRDITMQRIERCWAWLEHWGHHVIEVDLSGLSTIQLLDLRSDEEQRVRVLAENWETWW